MKPEGQRRTSKQIPLGIGGEKLTEHREMLPALEINNTVLWVNPDMKLPFALKKGKPAKLARFFMDQPFSYPKPEEKKYMEVRVGHGRSALLGRAIFRDKQGRLYRDFDIKGIGHVFKYREGMTPKIGIIPLEESRWYETMLGGLVNSKNAAHDRDMSEQFLALGLRTYRVVAIIRPEELVLGSDRVPIEDAREKLNLGTGRQPVIEVRAFGTRTRVDDLLPQSEEKRQADARLSLSDALTLIAQEQGSGIMTREEYVTWFAQTLGEQVGRMHRAGYFHGYLTSHNVTLDCRMVDLDSAGSIEAEPLTWYGKRQEDRDVKSAKGTVRELTNWVAVLASTASGLRFSLGRMQEIFMAAYERAKEADHGSAE